MVFTGNSSQINVKIKHNSMMNLLRPKVLPYKQDSSPMDTPLFKKEGDPFENESEEATPMCKSQNDGTTGGKLR